MPHMYDVTFDVYLFFFCVIMNKIKYEMITALKIY